MVKNTKLLVKLNEVPEDGRSWEFTETSKPNLNEHFQPEISIDKYKVNVQIRPLGNVYEIMVDYKLSYEAVCSLCAYEFPLPSKKTVKELVMINPKGQSRLDKQKSTSKNWNDELFCTELDNQNLNLGEFLREVILVEMPVRPLGFGGLCEKGACEPLQATESGDKFSSSNMNEWTGIEKNKPFSALKDMMKLKK